MMEEDPPGLDAACGAVAELLDALEPVVGVPPERVLLGGFSRGAVVATEVALRGGRPLAGLLLFSPTFARAALWRSLMRSRPALPVFMAHGRRDTFHPLALAEALRDELAAAGHTVDWVDFEDGHAVAPVAVARASVFVRRAVERWT
jgi:phospholipase/carboxylesterase